MPFIVFILQIGRYSWPSLYKIKWIHFLFFNFLIGPFDSRSISLQRPKESVCFSFHLLFPSFFLLHPCSFPFSVSGICQAYFHFKAFALTLPSVLLSLHPNIWISHFTSCLWSMSPPLRSLSQAPYLKLQPHPFPRLTLLIPCYCSVILLLIYCLSPRQMPALWDRDLSL